MQMRGADRAAFVLLTVGLAASAAGCSDPGFVTVQTELRQGPAAESKSVAVIPKGSAIRVSDCSNGWCRVSWNGRDGYILTKSVHFNESSRNRPEPNQPSLSGDDEATPDVAPVPPSSAD